MAAGGLAASIAAGLLLLPSGADGLEVTCQGEPPTEVVKGPQAPGEVFLGTQGRDVILGSPFGDSIRGRGGPDLICGSFGDDHLNGGKGADELYGEEGGDLLRGRRGQDYMEGGALVLKRGLNGFESDRCRGGRPRPDTEEHGDIAFASDYVFSALDTGPFPGKPR